LAELTVPEVRRLLETEPTKKSPITLSQARDGLVRYT
jgi:hypothetical protein